MAQTQNRKENNQNYLSDFEIMADRQIDRPTYLPTNQPTNLQMDKPDHREVTLPTTSDFDSALDFCQ